MVGKTREIAGGIEFKETLTNTELATQVELFQDLWWSPEEICFSYKFFFSSLVNFMWLELRTAHKHTVFNEIRY